MIMASDRLPDKSSRVLIVDPLHNTAIARLQRSFEVHVEIGPSEARLQELIRETHVLVMRSGVSLSAATIAAAQHLKLVARAGVGVDNIDIETAREAGVTVFNVPAQSAKAVAELAIGLVLAVTRRIVLADSQVRRDLWCKSALVGHELHGSTIGIVGLGQIGRGIARLALAFGMRVLATVAHASEERRLQLLREEIELLPLSNVLEQSEVMCLAVPLTERSRDLIAAPELSRMMPGAYLVNVGRGGVVNERDLYDALSSSRLAGAALDVVTELGTPNRLAQLENVVLTPHIGAMTEQAQERIGRTVVDSIVRALRGEPLTNRIC